MIRNIQRKIEATLRTTLKKLYGIEDFALPDASYPDSKLGDLSYSFVFQLAKTLKKNPRVIADQIVKAFPLNTVPEAGRLEAAGNGYLNFWLDRARIAKALFTHPLVSSETKRGKANVEHTSINPNKAAHVGHLRNACLGDTLVRLLGFHGYRVEIQNYIDDTGVQLADVVVGLHRQGKTLEDLQRIPGKIDYYLWDLYAETHHWLDEHKENRVLREQALKAMEERLDPIFSFSQEIADIVIRCHLKTMRRLHIEYELLARESDIIGLHFWQRTFELLKERGAIVKPEEGKNAGCWIMSLAGSEEFEDMENPDKVIVRSNGTVTYVGKDIAYQLWKFGLLGLDFYYRPFERKPDGSILWSTSTTPSAIPIDPGFGGADLVFNVIDQRQSYLQKIVAEGLRALGHHEQAKNSIHFSYEMVTLSPATAKELGFELSQQESQKSFVEMSGRKGIGVKADDLIDRLEETARERIQPLYPDLDPRNLASLASDIAAGALRYFMIKYTRNTIITFDLEEALSFEGETGPYLQYAMVRARSIFAKLELSGFETSDANLLEVLDRLSENSAENADSWAIIQEVIRTPDIVERTLRSLELSFFAKHVFQLAQLFNNYYHKYPVLHEADEYRKRLRIAVVKMFMVGMQVNLDLLGIPVPSRM